MTPIVDTMRSLLIYGHAGNSAWAAFAWCGGLLAVCYVAALRIFPNTKRTGDCLDSRSARVGKRPRPAPTPLHGPHGWVALEKTTPWSGGNSWCQAAIPLSTARQWPLIDTDALSSRNATASAISTGSLTRLMGARAVASEENDGGACRSS